MANIATIVLVTIRVVNMASTLAISIATSDMMGLLAFLFFLLLLICFQLLPVIARMQAGVIMTEGKASRGHGAITDSLGVKVVLLLASHHVPQLGRGRHQAQ